MKFSNLTIDMLAHYKSKIKLELECDANCGNTILREVGQLRSNIKKGKKMAFCSNTCQGSYQLKELEIKQCKHCNKDFTSRYNGMFCSTACGNYSRIRSEETNKKISESLKKHYDAKPKINKITVGKFSKLFTCTCKNCYKVGVYRKQTKYCTDCKHCYTESGRAQYIFTFNVYHYPELFDLDFLTKHGFRKTKGKNLNINGVSRDHKVSVSEALKNNYDPYYIKHPLNCELMLHSENQKKSTTSSLTYEELVKMVDDFDSKRK